MRPHPAAAREGSLVVPAALCAAVVGASNLAALAAETAFVRASDASELAAFSVASAAARAAVALLLAAGAARVSHEAVGARSAARFEAAFLALSAATLVAASAGALASSHLALWAACLTPFVLPALAPVIAYQSAAASIGPRRARQVLPRLAAAGTVGAVAAGVVAAGLGGPRGPAIALGIAAALLALAAAMPAVIARGRGKGPGASAATPTASRTDDGLGEALRAPLVRLVLVFAVASAALATTVDLAFKLALQRAGSPGAIAPAIAISHIASNAIILGLQLFATTRVVERLGLRGALGAAGGAAAMLGPVVVLLPSVASSFVLRFTEGALRYALGAQVADLLLAAAPAGSRTRAKALAKGFAGPAGALLAGAALAAFAASAAGVRALGALATALGVVLLIVAARAPDAYAEALRHLLRRPAVPLGGAAIAAHRVAVLGVIDRATTPAAMAAALVPVDPRFFAAADLERWLLRGPVESRRAIAERMDDIAASDEREPFLQPRPDDVDLEVETTLLGAARARGSIAPAARLARAVERGLLEGEQAGAEAFAEGSLGLVVRGRAAGADAAQKKEGRGALATLRRAARGRIEVADDELPLRVHALSALADLADPTSTPEMQRGLASAHRAVFEEAARGAMAIDGASIVPLLVRRLRAGPHVRVAARALRSARGAAVRELLDALPTTRGDGGVAPTALASGGAVTGTMRAARVLSRLGGDATATALRRLGEMGFRARDAVVRAVARHPDAASLGRELRAAAAVFVAVGEELAALEARSQGRPGLHAREVALRAASVRERLCDLAAAVDASGALGRARATLTSGGVRAEATLELVESALGGDVGRRAALLVGGTPAAMSAGADPRSDGWLGKARAHDAGELPSGDPMRDVLDRVRVLTGVPLFAALSGEELYPVAEVAERVTHERGEEVVREGDPSDALFVLVEGRCEVVREGARVGELVAGGTFGELGVLDGAPRAATVRTLVPCVLLRVPQAELDALLDESPELARSVIRHLVAFARER